MYAFKMLSSCEKVVFRGFASAYVAAREMPEGFIRFG